MCCWEFESGPIQIPIFKGKSDPFIYQSAWFWAKFWSNYLNFSILAQIWDNSEKVNPFMYQIWHLRRGHWCSKRLILLPIFAARPCRVFCTEYPWTYLHTDTSRFLCSCSRKNSKSWIGWTLKTGGSALHGFHIFKVHLKCTGLSLNLRCFPPACVKDTHVENHDL